MSRLSWIEKLDYYVDESNSSKLDAVDIEMARTLLIFQPDFHRKALVYGTNTEFGIRDIFFGIRDIVPDF